MAVAHHADHPFPSPFGSSDDQTVPAHEVVLSAVHPAVFIGFGVTDAAPFDVGVQVPIPEPFRIGFGRVAHSLVQLDAWLQGECERTGLACGPGTGLILLSVIGDGDEGPVVLQVVREPRRCGMVSDALEKETFIRNHLARAVFRRDRFEIVDGEFGVQTFLSALAVTHIIGSHGHGVLLQQQQILLVGKALVEHGEVSESVLTDDVLLRIGQYGSEYHQRESDVGDAGTCLIVPALEHLDDVVEVGCRRPQASEDQCDPGCFPSLEVIAEGEQCREYGCGQQAPEQLHEQTLSAVRLVPEVLCECGDTDEEECERDLYGVIGRVEISARSQVVGGQLPCEGTSGGLVDPLKPPAEGLKEMVEHRQAGLECDVDRGGEHQHAAYEHPEFPGPDRTLPIGPGQVAQVTAQDGCGHDQQQPKGAQGWIDDGYSDCQCGLKSSEEDAVPARCQHQCAEQAATAEKECEQLGKDATVNETVHTRVAEDATFREKSGIHHQQERQGHAEGALKARQDEDAQRDAERRDGQQARLDVVAREAPGDRGAALHRRRAEHGLPRLPDAGRDARPARRVGGRPRRRGGVVGHRGGFRGGGGGVRVGVPEAHGRGGRGRVKVY